MQRPSAMQQVAIAAMAPAQLDSSRHADIISVDGMHGNICGTCIVSYRAAREPLRGRSTRAGPPNVPAVLLGVGQVQA